MDKRVEALEGQVQGLKKSSWIISASIFILAVAFSTVAYRQQKMISLLDKTNQALDKTVQILAELNN